MSSIHAAIQALFPNLLPIWAHLITIVAIALVVLVALYRITAPPKSARLEKMTTTEPRWVRWVLTTVALLFMLVFLILPLLSVLARRCARAGMSTSPRWASPMRSRPSSSR